MITALIFDFNGTLLFDTPAHASAWKEFLQEKGCPVTDEDVRTRIQGRPNPEILRTFLGELTDEQVAALAEEKEAKYR